MVTLIAAMDKNSLIGTGQGGLPWEGMPRDKKHFRDYTAGKALLIGRRTFEEMSGWFGKDHQPIIITRNPAYDPGEDGHVAGGVDQAMSLAAESGRGELVVCGGAEIYRLALPFADRLILTLLHTTFQPSARGIFFPEWQGADFEEISREDFEGDALTPLSMTFLHLVRRGRGQHTDC